MLAGFLFLTIRNYITPEVTVTKVQDNSMLVKKYYFSGKVKPRKTIDVEADEKMYIVDVNVKNGQIVEPGVSLITFDTSKQNISINTKLSDLKNSIKKAEIDKLNFKKQLDDIKISAEKSEDSYDKAEEEHKKDLLLYKNGAITEKELEDKKYYLDNCKTDYENNINTLQRETEIYNMNIVRLDDEIKALKSELQFELNGNADEEYKLTINESGVYSLADKVYIEYITDQKIINEGDTIIKYSPYNSNKDMYLEAVLERETYEKAFGGNCTLYFWKTDEKKRNSISIESMREFSDYSEIVFSLRDELNEKFYVSDNIGVLAQSEEKYNCVVDKTAIVPIGDLKEDNYCYLYIVETEDFILGKTQFLTQSKYKILAVGDNTAALEPSDSSSKVIDSFSVIVNYATSVLENKMNVRVVN